MYEHIRYDVDDPVATITLHRPESLNAWTPTMEMEVRDALARATDDPAVVGIVLTGAGRGFCAGVDLKLLGTFATGGRDHLISDDVPLPGEETWGVDLRGPYSCFMSVPKPIIAAINGPVAGMAVAIVLACDVRFMAEDARLSTSFAERGLIAEWGVSWLLTRLTGSAAALDLLFTARPIDGIEAERIGIANRALPQAELLPAARAYITDLAARCSPSSMATIKRQVYQQLHAGLAEAERDARRSMMASFDKPDAAEGVKAFLQRRPPQFARVSADNRAAWTGAGAGK